MIIHLILRRSLDVHLNQRNSWLLIISLDSLPTVSGMLYFSCYCFMLYRVVLQKFCVQVLDYCFNVLMRVVKVLYAVYILT